MQIRSAVLKDLKQIVEIYNYEVLGGTATFDLHAKTEETMREWFDAHNKGHHPLLVAEENGNVVGYASLSPYRAKEAYFQTVELSIYVAKEARGKGIASQLLQTLLDYAEQNEEIHTIVSVITAGNEISAHLHEKFGFEFCGFMPNLGIKFGKSLGINNYVKIIRE